MTISQVLFNYIGSSDCSGYLGKTLRLLMINFSSSAQANVFL